MNATTRSNGRPARDLLSPREAIAEFRRMAAQAREQGQHDFEAGWARAADVLERRGTVEEVEPSADDPLEIDPSQLTFGFDVERGGKQ